MKNYLLTGVVCLALGAALSRALWQKTVTKTEVQERIEYRVVTKEKETTKPDGTKVVERVITDNSTGTRKVDIVAETPAKRPDWIVSGGVGLDPELNKFYLIQVQRRIAGPVLLGVLAGTDSRVGITVGIEF